MAHDSLGFSFSACSVSIFLSDSEDDQVFYDPQVIDVTVGTTVAWENVDNTMHTATSGNPDGGTDGVFDSDIMSAGDKFEFTFTDAGNYDYYCILHPWMIGTVNVE